MTPYDDPFKDNEPDYVFHDLMFIGTCRSFPEQYDVVYRGLDGELYQVGYVRLRGGKLSCSYPDVGHPIIYTFNYDELIGEFPNECERTYYLNEIAIKIKETLEGISHGYS